MSETNEESIVLNPEQKELLAKSVKEGVNSLYRQQAEKDLVKEIANRVKEEIGISPAKYRKLIKAAYEDSFRKLDKETTDILDLAEELKLYQHNPED